MTVTYSGQVAIARLCAFSRLLFYWRGSIYKLVYKEMLIFISLYATCSMMYRFALDESRKRVFERVVLYCETFTNLIPLSFVLGFYVAIVVTRWWNQYLCIPWPDKVMMYVTTVIEGLDERGRLLRRTVMRHLTLASLLVFQATSVSVKKRFPTVEHLIEAGILTESEEKALDDISTPHGKWWVPFVWISNILKDAFNEGRIPDSFLFKEVMDAMLEYRSNLGTLYSYDWISIPLVYTQVTTLATYTFFLGCIMGRQFLDPSMAYPGHDVDLYLPIFTVLQFFFYMGWLKVAEQMINPFGEDDDDFDMNWIIDRNMQVSLLGVDDMCGSYPTLEKDIYWDEAPPEYLPYTKSALSSFSRPFMGSTAQISVSDEGMKVVVNPMETIMEGEVLEVPGNTNELKSPAPSNPALKAESGMSSPVPIPHHSRRLFHNLNHHLSVSQVSVADSMVGSHHQLDSHRNVRQAASYLHYLKQNKSPIGSHPDMPSSMQSPKIGNSPMPGRRTHRYERGFSVASAVDETPCMSASTTMHDVSSPSNHEDLKHLPPGLPLHPIKPRIDFKEQTSQPSTPVKASVTFMDQVKEVVLQPELPSSSNSPEAQNAAEPKVCTITMGSSDSCVVEFELPDLNQCTVSSLTPLLGDDDVKDDGEQNLA